MPRARGSKNRQTVERETAKKIAAARAELVKNAPPLDFSMPLDSLGMMEHVVRRFYFRAKIAERLGIGSSGGGPTRPSCGPCARRRRWRAIGMPSFRQSSSMLCSRRPADATGVTLHTMFTGDP